MSLPKLAVIISIIACVFLITYLKYSITIGDIREEGQSVPQTGGGKENHEGVEEVYADHEDHCKHV